jgi:hypothetical protein
MSDMNNAQITALRSVSQNNGWNVIDGNGRVVMFGISEERAKEYAAYYKGGRAVQG